MCMCQRERSISSNSSYAVQIGDPHDIGFRHIPKNFLRQMTTHISNPFRPQLVDRFSQIFPSRANFSVPHDLSQVAKLAPIPALVIFYVQDILSILLFRNILQTSNLFSNASVKVHISHLLYCKNKFNIVSDSKA